MKIKPHLKDRLILAVMSYFGHKPERIRQAQIIPGKYYNNFSYICKAVPISQQEHYERQVLICRMLENHENRMPYDREQTLYEQIKSGCDTCPFNEQLPCPLNLSLPDGSKICHSHKFIIIKKPDE